MTAAAGPGQHLKVPQRRHLHSLLFHLGAGEHDEASNENIYKQYKFNLKKNHQGLAGNSTFSLLFAAYG